MTRETDANFDTPSTAFVGRDAEMGMVRELLEQGRRLITFLGAAGTGKTRLARELGLRCLDDFAGGVWFCDLSQARDEGDAVTAIASQLEISFEDAASFEQRRDRIGHALAQRPPLLLVLDNFEQVSEAATSLVAPWLEMTSEASLLVTSRERLRLAREYCIDLEPLGHDEAVQLFEARAGMAANDFEVTDELYDTVRRLVDHLDCLPLAIELAASRIRALPPEEMLDRISSRFRMLRSPHRNQDSRQATLEGAIQWSWEMLERHERDCLRQCTVFRGGFPVELAEDVIDLSRFDDAPWVVDVLESLIDKSVLQRKQGSDGKRTRIEMFESIREFVRQKIDAADHSIDLGERHGRAVLERAEQWVDEVDGTDGKRRLTQLRAEQANLFVAFERLRDRRPALAFRLARVLQNVLRYGGALEKHREVVQYMTAYAEKRSQKSSEVSTYRARADLREYRGDLEGAIADLQRALDRSTTVSRPAMQGGLLIKIAQLERTRGDGAAAIEHLEEALDLIDELARPDLQRKALAVMACVRADRGETDRVLDFVERARKLPRGNNLRATCETLNRLAYAHFYLDHFERQRAYQEQALEIADDIGDRRLQGVCLQGLADANLARSHYDRARDLYDEALEVHRSQGHRHAEGVLLANLGAALHRMDELEEAQRRYRKALDIHAETGATPYRAVASHALGALEFERERFDAARQSFERALELWERLEVTAEVVAMRICLSWVVLRRGRPAEAVDWLGGIAEEHGDLEETGVGAMASVSLAIAELGRGADREAVREAFRRTWQIDADDEPKAFGVAAILSSPYPTDLTDAPDRARVDGAVESSQFADRLRDSLYGRMALQLMDAGCLPEAPEPSEEEPDAATDDRVELVIEPDASRFQLGDREVVDLTRRGAMRRVLEALVTEFEDEQGEALDVHQLFDLGWPDEEIAPDQASNRVYYTIRKIRDMGFEGLLVTGDDGYLLDDAKVTVRRESTPS